MPLCPRWHLRTWPLLLAAVACNSPCGFGERSRCEGNDLILCGAPGKNPANLLNTGHANDCGERYCVHPERSEPFCALSPEPDPRCLEEARSFCEDDAIIMCKLGYPVGSQYGDKPVLAQCGPGLCVETASHSTTCALAPPGEGCPAGLEGPLCIDGQALRCLDGFVIERVQCEDGEQCGFNSIDRPHCVLVDEGPCASNFSPRCQGDSVVLCIDGQVLRNPPCEHGCVERTLDVVLVPGGPTTRVSCAPSPAPSGP